MSEPTPRSDSLAVRVPGARDWTELARAARSNEAQQEPELLRELLSFELADTPYAIPVERVREIVRPREITPMPRVPAAVLGVIELRGQIVQVVDLRMRLGVAVTEPRRKNRIIVLHGDDERSTGVYVDAVREVLRAAEDSISPPSSGAGGFVSEICLRGSQFVSILDVDRVLDFDAA